MKGTFARILSLLLVLSLVVSMFSIFAFAETGENADDTVTDGGDAEVKDPIDAVKEKYPEFKLLYQRAFDEGWGPKNGMSYVDRGTRVQVLDMPLNKYMSSGKSLKLSKPQLTRL